jgi:hypothetical protein
MARSGGFKVRSYYEGRTIGRQLDKGQIRALKRISRRVHVTETSFIGDFTKANDPVDDTVGDIGELMNEHFDVFLHFDGCGSLILMFRAPAVHADAVKPHLIGDEFHGVTSQIIGDDVVIRVARSEEDGELTYWKEQPEKWLDMLLPLHTDLAEGDMSVLYLGWQTVEDSDFYNPERTEPVPPPLPARLAHLDVDDLGQLPRRLAGLELPRSVAALDKILRFHNWPFDEPEGWPHQD